jgi:O-antigen/teichoic acid export membrane protein
MSPSRLRLAGVMKYSLGNLRRSTLARNTLWMLGGQGVKLIIQAVYFVVIARSLRPKEYGAFVAVVAITAILSPFVGLGTGNLIVRNVAREKESFTSSWGNGLLITSVTGFLGLFLVIACRFVLPADVHWTVLLLVAAADLIFARISDFCGFAFGAIERFGSTAQLNVWSSLARLGGLLVLVLVFPRPSVQQWAAVYLAATAVTAIAAVLWGLMALGRPSLELRRITEELKEGLFFSAGQSAQSIYNDIDKTMLAKLGSLSATGIYGAAYRLIEVSIVPVRSILSAAYPGLFRAGQSGISGSMGYVKGLLPKATAIALLAFAGLFLCAPIAPHILGHEYARTVEALRWLSVLPLLKTIHSFLADALTGAGYQRLRTAIQALVAAFNVLINLWIIPAYSWRGAAWSSIASDALLAGMLAVAVKSLTKKEYKATLLIEEPA